MNLDGNAASHRALRLLRDEDPKWKCVVVRCCRYLNNIVEQDHRAIKRRCASMLGLKSFRTAAITFAGIELANRISKRQFSFGRGRFGTWSLKQLWDRALAPLPRLTARRPPLPPARPPMHQNSRFHSRKKKTKIPNLEPLRISRKVFASRGLYLLVTPSGSRYWRYNYRFEGKHKTLALGVHPDVSLDKAKARHQVARTLLADGIDPSARKRALGNYAFTTQLR